MKKGVLKMTIDERETLFRKDLEKLLEKHKCTIDLEQRGDPYLHYDVIVINLDNVYDENGERICDYGEFDL